MGANEGSIELPAEVTRATRAVERAMLDLLRLLGSPDEAVRAGALGVLDGLGVVSIGYLTLGLATGKDPAYKIRLVEALGALAPLSRSTVVAALGVAAMDRDAEVRKAAARVVWGLETPRPPVPRPTPAGA